MASAADDRDGARQILVDLLAVVDASAARGWADRLIASLGGAGAALAAPPDRLLALLGDGRAVALIAAHRRAMLWTLRERAVRRPLLATRHDFLRYVRTAMAQDAVESLRAFFLNARRELIAEEEMARGGPQGVAIEPRAVLVRALALGATGVILVHNHPSGDPRPSPADRRFTQRLTVAGECLGIRLHDHLVVARDGTAAIEVSAA